MSDSMMNTDYIFDPAAADMQTGGMMDEVMIEAQGIKRCFRLGSGEDFYALKGIDMKVRPES